MSSGPFTSVGSKPHDNWTVSGARDAKTGLGYGVLDPKKQLPRQLGNQFPYYEQEDSANEENIDTDSMIALQKKYQTDYRPSDFFNAAGKDPFYFVGGNTKLSDCFWRIDKVLQEVATFSDSMISVPDLYKKAGPGLSNSGPAFVYPGGGGSNFKRTGTTRGWSHSPPESWLQADQSAEEDQKEEIFTLKDLADKILSDRGENLKKSHI